MLEDPRLHRDRVLVPRRDSYEKRPVLSATIHPNIKKTLVSMSKRTGMTVSQVADEVLYKGLIEMQELDASEIGLRNELGPIPILWAQALELFAMKDNISLPKSLKGRTAEKMVIKKIPC